MFSSTSSLKSPARHCTQISLSNHIRLLQTFTNVFMFLASSLSGTYKVNQLGLSVFLLELFSCVLWSKGGYET